MRIWLLGLAAAGTLLLGCGGSDAKKTAADQPRPPAELRKIDVTLDGYKGAQNVGILMAQKRGYFADAGLSVNVVIPATPAEPIEDVLKNIDDLAVAQEPQVVLAGADGKPVVAVASLVSQPTAAMIWLKRSDIRSIADLKGKAVGIPGVPFQEKFLQKMLTGAGLKAGDVKIQTFDYEGIGALIRGDIAALFGASTNLEGVKLEGRGLTPVNRSVRMLGLPAYDELVVVASARLATKQPSLIRHFREAVVKGVTAAIEDPQAAASVILSELERDPELSRKDIEAQLEATLPVLSRSGSISPQRLKELVDWMYRQGWVADKPGSAEILAVGPKAAGS